MSGILLSPRRRVSAVAVSCALLAALAAAMGCRWQRWRTPAVRLENIPAGILAVPGARPESAEGVRTLMRMFPAAVPIELKGLPAALDRCLEEGRILLIPSASHCPVETWEPLEGFLARGGAAIFIGREPFSARASIGEDGVPRNEAEQVRRLATAAREVEGFSAVQAWQPLNSWDEMKGKVLVARVPSAGWSGSAVDVEDFDAWHALVLDDVPSARFNPGENTLVLFVRGGARTSRLAVECEETDGSRWVHVLRLSQSWQTIALHEDSFHYFHGGRERGHADDRFSLSKLKRISIGLSAHLAPQAPGQHRFEVSDVRVAADDRPPRHVASWPDIPLVSPPFRRFDTEAVFVRCISDGRDYETGPVSLQSPLPRPRGTGGEKGAPDRWIPLFSAHNDKGDLLGWPASIHVAPQAGGPTRQWAWIGMEPSASAHPAYAAMITECARRLHTGIFLYRTGCASFSFRPGEPMRITARCAARKALPPGQRISVELYREGERFPSRRVLGPCPGEGLADIHLGMSPEPSRGSERGTLRISLEDPAQRLKYDVLEQSVLFLPAADTPDPADRLSTVGSHFAFRGRRLFLLGINYWPVSVNGRMAHEPKSHWLDPAEFDPELVARDLDRMAEAGINAVSIQYLDAAQAPQLRYFVSEARRRNIRVQVFVAHLQPLDQDLEKAKTLVAAAELANEPGVFALDIAWEPHLGREADRKRLDDAWRQWIVEQYGDVKHAEKVIGMPLWREAGELTGPPDEELTKDGSHRVRVAVYRRFVDDYMSRRYGHVVRSLRKWNVQQLVSARTGFGGTGNDWADPFFPMDPAAGAVHFDFICPEGWGLHGRREQFLQAAFITAYCRGVAGGKPVLWLEFGSSVGMNPQKPDLENQARVYGEMLEMILKSRGAGAMGWWYPGGYRVEERSDMGIVNPDGTWRPVGSVYRDFSNRIRREVLRPEPWRGREVGRDADARGLSALWDSWRGRYAEEMGSQRFEEVRPDGFGKRSSEVPLRSVGGVPFDDPAPLDALNAEWASVWRERALVDRLPGEPVTISQGEIVRLETVNTGPATWDASQEGRSRTVWIAFTHESGRQILLPIPPVPFSGRAPVSWMATDTGTWTARVWLADVGGVGEVLKLNVVP
ncbi:MAG: hypothetical protein BWY59_02273 [Verrucomicrobia bacterium ADurb.Bin345]|nr:MAG: hypothetical protein BWY59_02273 [Verrucomicrobia bacterium ADurb.Bin345]